MTSNEALAKRIIEFVVEYDSYMESHWEFPDDYEKDWFEYRKHQVSSEALALAVRTVGSIPIKTPHFPQPCIIIEYELDKGVHDSLPYHGQYKIHTIKFQGGFHAMIASKTCL